ncbi:F-box/kelch-repeat protein SKIP30-like [Lotus japonicus]|uniref:F-box/kelch-repeat protein SKIP30-like n=1 Tax=Lotus japonicus TaxID=34305 RepID=UPI00258B10E4|nr:F-box/kelch-repeat protein SKIP30-like [Lotus japonicus]
MSGLIEGLPDDVAIRCLARVPFFFHPNLKLVSRSWNTAIHSPELFKARQEVGSSEELLCVYGSYPHRLWQMYDPLRDLWVTLPFIPSKMEDLSDFGAVSTAGKLFVIGGARDRVTDEVWSYDPVVRQWACRASMLVPRYDFACCVLNGKIVVAGGITSRGESTYQAEMYDPEKDIWIAMPNLHPVYNSACSGLMIGGKMDVLHNHMSTVQVLDNAGTQWIVEECGWDQQPKAVVQGAVYVLSRLGIYRQKKDGKIVEAAVCKYGKRTRFAMIGLGEDLYVIGGLSRDDGPVRPLSDVNVFMLGNESPTWRQAAPMTRCRGPIHGCTLLRI